MNWDAIGTIAEALGAAGVIATLAYLAMQIRANTRVVNAQSRHQISEQAQSYSAFRAEHADRMAKINRSDELSDEDREFLLWTHTQMLIFGENYHYHHELGLMPDSHWRGFVRFLTAYSGNRHFMETWKAIEDGLSENYRDWVREEIISKLPAAGERGL